MAASCQVVRFAKETTGVASVTQDVNLNFTPKAIIVLWTGQTADNTVEANAYAGAGFSDGTNHACIFAKNVDNQAAGSSVATHRTDSVTVLLNTTAGSGTVTERSTCTFATNKVTFTWAVNTTAATDYIVIAFGGDDITNAKVGTGQAGAASTADFTGLGFNPVDGNSVLFTLCASRTSTNNTSTLGSALGLGCAVSTSKRWVTTSSSETTSDPSDTWQIHSTTNVIEALSLAAGSRNWQADFNGWITDGFQLDVTVIPGDPDNAFSYLVIKGGTWDVGTLATPAAATNNVDTAVSVNSNTIRGLVLSSVGGTAANLGSIVAINQGFVSATDGTNQAAIGWIDEDAQATTDSYRVNTGIQLVRLLTTNGAASHTGTIDSFPTNNFRIDYSAAPSAIQIGWVVVADGVVAAEVSYQSYGNIFQAYDSNKNAIYG